MNEKPYTITLRDETTVDLPDRDGDIRLEFIDERTSLYLSKEEVLKLLERFN